MWFDPSCSPASVSVISQMRVFKFVFVIFLVSGSSIAAFSQGAGGGSQPSPTPSLSKSLAKRLDDPAKTAASRSDREAAFAKLMEGQRYAWAASRTRNATRAGAAIRVARQAFQAAVELDPTLAEGYTALAELEISQRPTEGQVDEAIELAKLAVRVGPDNFGARRLMARLYAYKSKVGGGGYENSFGELSASEWREVVRLDPRNAEAWAFLSALYERQGKTELRIEALRKWLGAATPVDIQFYRFVMGSQENLAPESASMKLGAALIAAGRTREAIEVLSTVISDDPANATATELLREAVESAEGDSAAAAIESLQQAVYANPENLSLINLLARIYVRADRFDDAERLYESAANKLTANDRETASQLQIALGDMFADANQIEKAIAAYERALTVRGLDKDATLSDDERVFAMQAFEKLINANKKRGDPKAVQSAIERARKLFGNDDLFADRQLINFYREEGRRKDALDVIRAVRTKFPDDNGFVRLEATILTEMGRVDDAVTGFTAAVSAKPAGAGGASGVLIPQDEFSNLLFVSNLYTQANRGKEAAAAANKAFEIARGTERKQIARLTLATAQNMSGDFAGAEATLREILKQSPTNPIALNNLGYFLLERGDKIEEAKAMIEQAVQTDPTNPSYLDSLGWVYFKMGNFSEAERYLKEANRYDPGSSTILEHLGDAYQKQNRMELARQSWQRSLKLASDPVDVKRLKEKLAK